MPETVIKRGFVIFFKVDLDWKLDLCNDLPMTSKQDGRALKFLKIKFPKKYQK
jgi:hypothetical protein